MNFGPGHFFKVVLFLLGVVLLPATGWAQLSISPSTPVVKSCLESDTIRVVLTNNSSSTLDSLRYKPEFPQDVTYVTGSAQNMVERDTANKNKPVFTYTGTISPGDSVILKYVVEGGCSLNDQNKFPTIIHKADRFISGSSSSYSITDTLATFVTPDLAIASTTVSGSAYTYVGDTIEIKIKLSNNSYGDVQSFTPELTLGSSLTAISSSLGNVSQSGNTVTISSDSVVRNKSDIEFTVKVRVTSCTDLNAFLKVYWGCPDDKCNTESKNIGQVKTIPSASIEYTASLLGNSKVSGPFCAQDTMWSSFKNVTSEPYIAGSGTIYDVGIAFTNDRFNSYFTNGIVDSLVIIIGDTSFTVSQKDYTIFRSLNGLNRDIDGPGGLSDVDGDGRFDDLASGDSLLVGLLIKPRDPCMGITGTVNVQDEMKINMELYGRDGCGNSSFKSSQKTTHFLTAQNLLLNNQFYSQTTIDTANPVSVLYRFKQIFPRKCGPGAKVRTYFTFPNDVTVKNFNLTGISNPYSSYFQGDTMVVDILSTCTDTINNCTIDNINVRFEMHMDCNTKTRIHQIEYITTILCDTSCNDCELVTRRGFMPIVYFQPCASSNWCSGATLDQFDVNRITLGYDSVKPLHAIPPANAKTKVFIPYDTVLVEASGILASTNWDSLKFTYETTPKAIKNFMYFQHAGAILYVYDSSGNYKGSCDSFATSDSLHTSFNQYTWNLSKHGCSSFPALSAGDSLVFRAYLTADSMPYYGGYSNYLILNRGFFSVDSGANNYICNYLGTNQLRYHTTQMNFEITHSVSCAIFGDYGTQKANDLCTPNAIFLLGKMDHLLETVPFGNEYRPFLKIRKIKYFPSPNVSVEDSFSTVVNMGLYVSHLRDYATDSIYHTRNGDTLVYDLSDTSHLPFGYSSCYRNVFGFFLPITINCNDGEGAYMTHSFLIDYDINLHAGDTTKVIKHRNYYLSSSKYLSTSSPAITHNIDYIDATTDTSYWELRIQNTTTSVSPYQTLFFKDNYGTFADTKIFRVEVDGVSYYPTSVDSATVRVDLDTFRSLQDKTVKIFFTTRSCSLDEISYTFGAGCSPIKTIPYDNICTKRTGVLKVDPKPINPRVNIIEEPSSSNVDLCEVMHYEVELTNSQVANGSNVRFYFLPPAGNGFDILPDSCYFYYKDDTTKHYALGSPTYDSTRDRYRWDLSSNHILGGINSSISDFVFHMVLAPNCNFRQNDYVRFQASAIAPCHDSLASNIATGQNIILNNISNTVVSHYSRSTISVTEDNLCDTFAIRYTWVNTGNDLSGSSGHTDPDTTTNVDYMEISLPTALISSGLSINALTSNASGISINNQYTSGGTTYIQIPLPSGLDKNDSIAYEVKFVPDHSSSCSDSFSTSIYNYFVFENYCATLADTCRLVKETGYYTKTGINLDQRWDFDIEDLAIHLLLDTVNDQAVTRFKIKSNSSLNNSNPIYLDYYYDRNKNGVLDANDTALDQFVYRQPLSSGDSLIISDTITMNAGWSCGLLVALRADSNCVCNDFDTIFPTPVVTDLSYSDTVCYSNGFTLNIGQKLNSTYQYKWSGDTSAFSYTDTLQQPTVQYRLENPESDTSFRFIREITMGDNGCQSYDSVDLWVLRTPEVNLGPDIHNCVFDSFDISITPHNYDILWHDGSTDSNYTAYDDELIFVTVSNSCGSASDTMMYYMEALDIFSMPFITDSIQCRKGNFFIVGANISNQSTDTIRYVWDWKDGSNTYVNPGSHTYSSTIDDTIKVVATNGWCTDSMTTHLKVVANPTSDFDFGTLDSCLGTDSFRFNFNGSIEPSFTYTWNFGDGTSTVSSDTIYKSYTDTGTYSVKLVVALPGGCSDSTQKQVTVYPTPMASFSIDDSLQCLKGNSFNFTNTSSVSSGTMTYNWDFGDATTSTSQSPNKTYTNHGTYTIELIATSAFACADTVTDSIQVFQQPIAGFNIIKNDSCLSYNSFDFVNTSSIASDSLLFNWSFGDGNTGTDSSYFNYSYNSDSTFTVQLIAATLNNCRDTFVDSVNVYPNPVASFSIDDSLQCLKGNSFNVTNTSSVSSGTMTYNWDFGDATTSSSQSPNKTYTNYGTYTIELIATSAFACADTVTDSIQVFQQPVAGFNITKNDSCLNYNSFDFVNTSSIASDSLLFNWSFGDGNTGTDSSYLNYSYSSDSTFTVQLIAATLNNCRDTFVDSVNVYPNPVASFSIDDSLQCLKGNSFNVTNTSSISSGTMTYNWDFGDATTSTSQSPNKTYTNHGTYTIELITTSTFACADTVTDSLQVFQQPVAGFNIIKNDSCLSYNSFDFVNTSSIASDSLLFNWSFGDGNTGIDSSYFNYSYNSDSTFTVQLIAATLNNCRDTFVDSVNVYPNPVASFSIDDSLQCLKGNSFNVTNTSSVSSGTMTYNWDFGDATTSTSQSPNKTYTNHGTYTIELIATSAFACTDTVTDSLQVFQQPVAGFNIIKNDSCLSYNSFDFVNTSSIASDSLLFNWSFGNGNTGTDSSYLNYSYNSDGTFTVQLIAATLNNCRDTFVDSVNVYPNPVASFSIDDSLQCLKGNSFNVTNTSSVSSGTMTYNWDFGDATTSSSQSPNKTYTNHGTYTIELIATSAFACSDTVTDSLQVFQQPVAGFNITKNDSCLSYNSFDFVNASSIASDSLLFSWSFGNGNTGIDSSYLNYSYNNYGSFQIELKTTTKNGCSDSVSKSVSVYPMPVASVSVTDSIQCFRNNNFTFTNNSTVSGGTLTHYFDFGNSTTSTVSAPNMSYNSTGTYQVTYIATSQYSCADTQTLSLSVLETPIPAFSIDSAEVCEPANLFHFYNESTIASGSLSYQWRISDGYNSTSDSVLNYHFNNAGSYTVELVAIADNSLGCKDSISTQVNVLTEPVADFTINEDVQCLDGNLFVFTNTGTQSATYQWTFGDGSSGSDENPTHSYSSVGDFNVWLHTSLHGRCYDSIMKTVRTRPVPDATFTWNAPSQCFNDHQVNLALTGPLNGAGNILWDLGDGTTATDSAIQGKTYPAPGIYHVKVTVSSGQCSDSSQQSFEINPNPEVAFEGDSVCLGDPIRFINNTSIASGVITGYKWDFGDSQTSSGISPSHTYGSTGYFNVILTATSDDQCKHSDTARAVLIYPTPVASMLATPVELNQNGQLMRYTSTSTDADDITWYFDDQTSDFGTRIDKVYPFSGHYSLLMVASTVNGCADSISFDTTLNVPRYLFIPNSFSPNGDNINDSFGVDVRGEPLEYHMSIFNRWGEKIFDSEKPGEKWDGTYMGKTVQNGTYLYIIYVKVPGAINNYSGTVNVER